MESGGAASGVSYERVVEGASVMLYDPRLASNFTATWFDPEYWQAAQALRSVAQGRGNTWFVDAPMARSATSKIWVLRHYRRGGGMARILGDRYWYRGWEASRPWREFMLLQSLRAEALPVPQVIGARMTRDGHWYRGDLITEAIKDSVTLASRLLEGTTSETLWWQVGHLVARLHRAGVQHADLNAHNILLAGEQLWLIDFDRSQRRAVGLWCDAVLVRLRRSLLKVSDRSAQAQFSEKDWITVLAAYREGMSVSESAP